MGAGVALNAAYLDASAVVKLLFEEAETAALVEFLAGWPLRASSQILSVEVSCVCHRQGIPAEEADELLSGIRLLPLTARVLEGAQVRFNPPQRALDAIHLASAEHARAHMDCFVSYDSDQIAAAAALGWMVKRPA
jgi:uncharacterized protein